MNLDHLQSIAFVQKLGWALKDAKYVESDVEVALFPPFTDLRSVQTLINADSLPFAFGAQDLSMFDDGAHTGDISGLFLKALECSYVIVGHSERRADHREDDAIVAAKSRAAIRHSLVPIVCVGETAEDLETHERLDCGRERAQVRSIDNEDAEQRRAGRRVWQRRRSAARVIGRDRKHHATTAQHYFRTSG